MNRDPMFAVKIRCPRLRKCRYYRWFRGRVANLLYFLASGGDLIVFILTLGFYTFDLREWVLCDLLHEDFNG